MITTSVVRQLIALLALAVAFIAGAHLAVARSSSTNQSPQGTLGAGVYVPASSQAGLGHPGAGHPGAGHPGGYRPGGYHPGGLLRP
jgi:hypothetical protein